MTQINLIPWREQARQTAKMQFVYTLVGFIILAIFLIFIYHFIIQSENKYQLQRNNYLQSILTQEQSSLGVLNIKKKAEEAIAIKVMFLVSLPEKSFQAIRLLDALVRVIPSEVTLNKLVRQGSEITLLGQSQSNLKITELMENMAKVPMFKQPNLNDISSKETSTGEERFFTLKVEERNS